jgi:hypothetical protein
LEDAFNRIDPRRESNRVAFDVRDQPCRDEMVMTFMRAGTAAVTGKLDLSPSILSTFPSGVPSASITCICSRT